MSDDEVNELAKKFETEIKLLKKNLYKLSWYMRGGVDYHNLLVETDLEDIEVMNKVIEDNIETVKKTKMPLL